MKRKITAILFALITLGASPVYAQWMQTAGPKILTQNGWEYTPVKVNLSASSDTGDTILYAGTTDGLYISSDDGNSWVDRNTGLVDGTLSNIVLCMGRMGDSIYASTYSNLFYSTNEGVLWEATNFGSTVYSFIFVDNDAGAKLFVGTQVKGVHLSTDMGLTWEERSAGLLINPDHTQTAFSMASVSLTAGQTVVFAGTMRGVYRTTNDGLSWSEASVGLPLTSFWPITEIAPVITNSGETIIFIGTHYGVFRSTDNGDTWENKSIGLPIHPTAGTTEVSSIISIPRESGNPFIIAGLRLGDNVVWISTDLGETWINISQGLLPNHEASSLVLYNSYLYAALYNGVWRRSLSEIITTGIEEPAAPVAPALPVSYPNPVMSGEQANIAFSLERSSNITLRLYSTLGKEVRVQSMGQLAPGNHTATLATNALPPGVYYYILYPSSGTALTGKIAIAR